MMVVMSDKKLIRNSTAEFLMFTAQDGKDSIETRYENETVWLTQKLIAELFEVDISTVNEHLKNIYKNNELVESSTIGKFPIVQKEGNRNVKRTIGSFYIGGGFKYDKFKYFKGEYPSEHILQGNDIAVRYEFDGSPKRIEIPEIPFEVL